MAKKVATRNGVVDAIKNAPKTVTQSKMNPVEPTKKQAEAGNATPPQHQTPEVKRLYARPRQPPALSKPQVLQSSHQFTSSTTLRPRNIDKDPISGNSARKKPGNQGAPGKYSKNPYLVPGMAAKVKEQERDANKMMKNIVERKLKFMGSRPQSSSLDSPSPSPHKMTQSELHNAAVKKQNKSFTNQLKMQFLKDDYEESDPTGTSEDTPRQRGGGSRARPKPQMITVNVDLGSRGIIMLQALDTEDPAVIASRFCQKHSVGQQLRGKIINMVKQKIKQISQYKALY